MRWLGCLALAACYSPTIADNVPCGDGDACPSGQRCYGGTCFTTPPVDGAHDASPDVPPDSSLTCSGVDSVLNSPCVGTFSDQGMYFDLEAKEAIGVTGFSTMSQQAGMRNVSIYFRRGTHVGSELDPAKWQLVGSANNFAPANGAACPLPPTLIPITTCIGIAAGERVAFYIATTAGLGSFEVFEKPLGQVVVEDMTFKLYAGRSQDGVGAFGAFADNKAFQGVVHTSR